jgi:hypothetical protein
MEPMIQIHALGIALSVVASFLLGMIWYSFLFNKAWKTEMQIKDEDKLPPLMIVRSLGLNILGTLIMVWVFSHEQAVWDARTWGHPNNWITDNAAAGLGAFFTWLGFYLPQDLNKISFGNKSWKLFAIDTAYNFCSLLIVAFVLMKVK